MPNRIVGSILKPCFAVSFANRTLRIAVICRVRTLIEIPTHIPVLTPGQGAFAVAAAHKTLERIIVRVAFWLLYTAPDNCLSQFKLFLADNGFVHPLNNNPVFLFQPDSFP